MGIKTKPMGDIGRELREMGWKSAPYPLAICILGCAHTHTYSTVSKAESIMTIRGGR